MQEVQEIIYVVPEEREAYIQKHLNPSEEIAQILWVHGVRNQFFYMMGDLILLNFQYEGKEFYKDMEAIANYPIMKTYLVRKRRKEVPQDELETTNWWAPLKKLGSSLTESPMPDEEEEELSLSEMYHSMVNGYMDKEKAIFDVTFDEDDWSESIQII